MTEEVTNLISSIRNATGKLLYKCQTVLSSAAFVFAASTLALRNIKALSNDNNLDEYNRSIAETHLSLEKSLNIYQISNVEYYLSLIFIDLISSTEIFFIDLVKIVLKKYPKKLGKTQFNLSEIIDSSSHDELITKAADQYIHKLLYKKPNEYLSDICEVLSIDKELIKPYWGNYIEAKARRDLGIHNDWKCNTIYLRKLKEVGIEPQCKIGDLMFPLGHQQYLQNVSQNIIKLSETMKDSISEKLS